MKLILVLLIGAYSMGSAQTTTTTVKYTNELSSLAPEVPKEEALYSRSSTKYYGDITLEDVNLKTNRLISRKTYRSGEPYGKWEITIDNRLVALDYSFHTTKIKSKDELCSDSLLVERIGKNVLEDNPSKNYKAPRLKGDVQINEFIGKELIYPPDALKYNFNGQVYIQFELSKEAKIENVLLVRGKEKHLDKEAERVVRALVFESPAYLDEEAIRLCMLIPIGFSIN
jgi:hypothetical protein